MKSNQIRARFKGRTEVWSLSWRQCLSPAKFVQVSHVCLATASVEYFWSQWSGKYLELVGRNLWGREQFNCQIRPGETQGDLTHPTGRRSFILNFNVRTECWSPGQHQSALILLHKDKKYLNRWKWCQKISLSFPKYLFQLSIRIYVTIICHKICTDYLYVYYDYLFTLCTAAGPFFVESGKSAISWNQRKTLLKRICLIYSACSTTTLNKNEAEKDICSQFSLDERYWIPNQKIL